MGPAKKKKTPLALLSYSSFASLGVGRVKAAARTLSEREGGVGGSVAGHLMNPWYAASAAAAAAAP